MCCRITTEKAETFRHGYEAGFNFRAASSEQTPRVGDVTKERNMIQNLTGHPHHMQIANCDLSD